MADQRQNKTAPTGVPVSEFLDSVSDRRRGEALTLIRLMQEISGDEPVMWGPSIIGFGRTHYQYDTGREGDMGVLGFSPRKAAITVYFSEGFDMHQEALAKLGKHKTSVSCLYISDLSDIDLDVLGGMLRQSFRTRSEPVAQAQTPDEYARRVPQTAQAAFQALRLLITSLLPDAEEVISYGIVGYKTDARRARLYISGFKDRVGLYPIPRDETLHDRMAPYIRGKGTLHFALTEELPADLITDVVRALTK